MVLCIPDFGVGFDAGIPKYLDVAGSFRTHEAAKRAFQFVLAAAALQNDPELARMTLLLAVMYHFPLLLFGVVNNYCWEHFGRVVV